MIVFLEPVFTEVRNSGLQGSSVREKRTVSQKMFFFGIFKILEGPFFSEYFKYVYAVQSLSPAVDSKGNSTKYVFLIIFYSFRHSYFKRSSVANFNRVLRCIL